MSASDGEGRTTMGSQSPKASPHAATASFLDVTLANRLPEIERLNTEAAAFWESHGVPAAVAFKFDLAFDEILTNIIHYGYDDEAQHTIAVRLEVKDGWAQAIIEDDAHPFDPEDAPPPDLESPVEDRPIGGLGLFLVKEMMDRVDYVRASGRNRLSLSRRIMG